MLPMDDLLRNLNQLCNKKNVTFCFNFKFKDIDERNNRYRTFFDGFSYLFEEQLKKSQNSAIYTFQLKESITRQWTYLGQVLPNGFKNGCG